MFATLPSHPVFTAPADPWTHVEWDRRDRPVGRPGASSRQHTVDTAPKFVYGK